MASEVELGMNSVKRGRAITDLKMPKQNESKNDPIDAALRQLYNATIEEPLPAEFVELLEQIDRKINSEEAAE